VAAEWRTDRNKIQRHAVSQASAKAEQNARISKLLRLRFARTAAAKSTLRERAAKWGATEHVSSIPSPPCWQALETRVEPFPETDKEFADILTQLRQLDPNDLKSKLVVGGFLNHPYGPDKQRCMECMYYLVHRRWCDLPELSVPVEPDWWCRLWRI
jgi:hypothetical protein